MAEQEKTNLELLHQQLIEDKYAVPSDYKTFESTFSNDENAKALFDQLTEDKYAIPADYDSFASTFGLKKKGSSADVQTLSKLFSQVPKDTSVPQEQTEVTPPETPEITKQATVTEADKESYAGDLLERIGAGAIDIAASGPKQMTFAQRILDVPRKILKKELSFLGISDETAEKVSQSIPFLKPKLIDDAVNVSSAIWNKIATTDEFKNIEKKAVDLRESSARYDQTIEQLIKAKEYKKVVGASFLSAAESFPLTVTAMFGGPVGLGSIGMYSASAQYDQLAPNTDMTEVEKMSNAFLNGGLEIITERLGTANYGKLIKGLYETAGKEVAEEAVKKGLKTWFVNLWKKAGIYTAPIGEGIEEAVNQLGSNITARVTGEDPERALDEGVIGAATSGLASGTVFTTVGLPGQIKQQQAAAAKKKAGTTDKGTSPTETGPLEVPPAVAEQKAAEEAAATEKVSEKAPEPVQEEITPPVEETKPVEEVKPETPPAEEVKTPEVTETPKPKPVETKEAVVETKPVETRIPKKKKAIKFKPESRTFKAINTPANDFTESVLQFFLGGGRIKTDDFIAHTGYQRRKAFAKGKIELDNYYQLLSKEGTSIDVFNQQLSESFGRGASDEGMDMIDEVIDIMKKYPNTGDMLLELERRQKGQEQETPSDEEVKFYEDKLLKEKGETIANSYDIDEALKSGLLTKEEYDEITENESREAERSRVAQESFYSDQIGEGKGSKGEGITPQQQDQIDAINEDYDSQVAEREKALLDNKKVKDKTIAEAQDRQGLFGDTKDTGEAKMFSQEEQGFGLTPERLKAVEQPFKEKESEINKQIARLEKERQSKIGEVKKQTSIAFEETPKKEYQYKMQLRPFDIGTYPKEGFVKAENDPEGGHQILTYDRKLTPKELDHWSFTPLTQIEETKGKTFVDKDGYYSRIELKWLGNKRGADVSMYDQEGKLVEQPFTMSNKEIFENIETEYWNEKPNEPSLITGKAEENILPGGTETAKKPTVAKGEEKPVAEVTPAKDGIVFKDKTYQSVDEVQDAIANKEITFEESSQLMEDVRNLNLTPEKVEKKRRAKNKKAGIEPITDKPEELAWDEPLPLSTKEDPNYKYSDLNNSMSIRNLGRNLIQNLGLTEGADIRVGFIKRFSRKARALFNPVSGIIRVNNIRDLRALTHEIGHKIDFEIFDIRGIISAAKSDPQLGTGVDFNGKTYSNIPQVEKAMKDGTISITDGNFLIDKVKIFEKKKLKEKYSEIVEESKKKKPDYKKLRTKYGPEVVDGVLQRLQLKKEFSQLLKDIGYPSKDRQEGIAEFVYNYVIDPKQLINSTPNALAWFEKMLDNAPAIKEALHQLRQDYAKYDAQDVRTKGMAEMKPAEETKTPWLDGLSKLKDKMLYSLVNQLQYLEQRVKEWEKIPGIAHEIFKNPWVSAKELIGIDGKVQQFLLHSPYSKKGNDIVLNKNVKAFIPIIKHLIGTNDYLPHQTYLVALDAIESHNRGLPQQAYFDKETAVALKNAFEKEYGAAKLMEFQADIQKYNESLLDFMVESGRISKETADYWKKQHQNYVPLKRIAETYEKLKGKQKVTRDMLPESEKVIFARKGSMKQIKDIFESIIENTYSIIGSSERNLHNLNIRDMFFDLHNENKRTGKGGAVIEEINPNHVVAYQHPVTGEISYALAKERASNFKSPKGRILTVYEQGKPRFYDVAPEYYDNIFQSTMQVSDMMSKIIRVASAPSRWLQAGAVVYDPTFPIRNVARDQLSSWFYSKHRYVPTDFAKGLMSAIKKDDYYQKWIASGGDQSFLVSADEMISKDYMSHKIGAIGRRKFKSYAKNPLRALQDFSKMSEIGTRLGAFRNAYKKTGNVHLAAVESRDISADYGIKGATSKHFMMFYPFLNARTQHLRMTAQAMKNPAFLLKGMAIMVPAILNWLNNNRDEESKKLYQSLSTFRRLAMFNIRIPGTDHFFPLPKGFFGTMFGTSVEAMLDAITKDDPRVLEELPTQLFKEISPVGNIMEGVPFILRPFVEDWANKKGYTGKPIVSESMKMVKPSEQYYNSTPEIIKKVGQALDWSPLRIQHYFNSYTGGAGAGAINIVDEGLQQLGLLDQKPEDTFTMLSRMPVFKALLTEKPVGLQSGYISDFYETLDKIEKVNVTFNKLVKTEEIQKLDKFMQDPDNYRMYTFYEGNSTAINSFRNALIWIRDHGYAVMKDPILSKQQKKDEVIKMNEVVQNTLLRFKDSYEKNEFFKYEEAMDEIIKKMKAEKKDSRYDLTQQSNLYNPYWMNLHKKDPETFNALKDYGGFKEIKQNRSVKVGKETVELSLEDVRTFNEFVVDEYAKNLKKRLGSSTKRWESLKSQQDQKHPDKTKLDIQFEEAWNEALDDVQGKFKPQVPK